MQAQSRLSVNGGGGGGGGGGSGFEPAAADERDAVVRELTRGHELTARLQEEALRALRGQGQAEATAAFILREVSRAFSVCLSIMGGAGSGAPATATARPADSAVSVGSRRAKDDSVPRTSTLTSSPDSDDGHQWRKYGQKKINNTKFPRHYYRCKQRRCPATKQVQKHSEDNPPLFLVIYVHEHTCHTLVPEPADTAANDQDRLLDFSGLSRQQPGAAGGVLHGAVDLAAGHGDAQERERQALVSSLACVLGGAAPPPEETWLLQGGRAAAGGASTSVVFDDDASPELPMVDVDEGFAGLDIMDYDVTDTMFFGGSDGLPF